MTVRKLFTRAVLTAVATIAAAVPALAGPPLLCHPFDIGAATSLPWNGTNGWFEGQPGYNLAHLVADTEALLVPATPVVVRMETLRRAAIYASRDRAVAERLLTTLTTRAQASEKAGHADALAFLDAAYVAGAFRQIGMLGGESKFRDQAANVRDIAARSDAYALMRKSLAARANDPALEFAAALIASDSNRTAYLAHAQKARDGAQRDALVAKNIGQVSGT